MRVACDGNDAIGPCTRFVDIRRMSAGPHYCRECKRRVATPKPGRVRLQVMVPEGMYHALQQSCQQSGLSFNEYIIRRLRGGA